MESPLNLNDTFPLDGKDKRLLTEDENFYLLLVLTLEFLGPPSYQLVPFKDILKYFKHDDELVVTTLIIQNLKKVYDTFRITNYNLYIHYFDEYFTNLRAEINSEKDPLKKKKLTEIWDDICSLDPYLRYSTEKGRILLDRENFDYSIGFKAFNYLKDEIKVFFDIFPSDFSDKKELNDRLKILFKSITDISKDFEVSGIIDEIKKSESMFLDFSEGKNTFKIPFKKIGTIKGVNLIRLMKYWETEGSIEVDDWLGDEDGWNIRTVKKGKKESKTEFSLMGEDSLGTITENNRILFLKLSHKCKSIINLCLSVSNTSSFNDLQKNDFIGDMNRRSELGKKISNQLIPFIAECHQIREISNIVNIFESDGHLKRLFDGSDTDILNSAITLTPQNPKLPLLIEFLQQLMKELNFAYENTIAIPNIIVSPEGEGNHQYIKELIIDSVILFDGTQVSITRNQYKIIKKFTGSCKINVPISRTDLKITEDAFKKTITRLNNILLGKISIRKVRGKNLWYLVKGAN